MPRRRRRGRLDAPAAPPGRRLMRKGWIVFARSTTVDGRPESVDAGVAHVREHVVPAALRTDGCVGLSVLVDHPSGCCILTTAWRSDAALRAADAVLRPHVERVAALLGGRPEDEEWEIAVFHRGRPAPPGAVVRTVRVQVDAARVDHAAALYRMVLLPKVEEFEGFCSASLLVDRTFGHTVSSVV